MMPYDTKHDRADRWAADIQFVLDEVLRFAVKDPREYEDQNDVFSDLPHPLHKGFKIICGRAAEDRLWGMAETFLISHKMAGRVELNKVVDGLRYQVSNRFIKKGNKINKSAVQAALEGAVKRAAKECMDITHFIPCHIANDTDPRAFSIGPVIFSRREDVLNRLEPAFEHYVDSFVNLRPTITADAAKGEGRLFVKDATTYFGHFTWVAEVTINGCVPNISKEIARQCLQMALDVLRLMLGQAYSSHITVEGPPLGAINTAELTMIDEKLDIRWGQSWPGRVLGDGWWQKIVEQFSEERLLGAGRPITMLANMERDKPLCQRLLDGFTWFGQAVTERQHAAKIVKFVNCIERLTQCAKNDDYKITESVCNRSAALAFDFQNRDFHNWKERMKGLYDIRSKLVHGSMSPLDERAMKAAREAEVLATSILCRALDFFMRLGLDSQDWSPEQLNEQFLWLVAWAEKSTLTHETTDVGT